MSRIGKKPVTGPKGVTLTVQGNTVAVKGPKGELRADPATRTSKLKLEDGSVHGRRGPARTKRHKALHGLTRTLVANMVEGVTKGFTEDARDPGRRLQGRGQAVRRQPDRRVLPSGEVQGAQGHQDHGGEQHAW